MKKKITPLAALAMIGLCCGLMLSGCSRKAQLAVDVANPYQHLEGASNVLATVDQKNYEEGVAALVKLKEFATSEEQQSEYALLSQAVRDKLRDAAATDEKAAAALQAFRFMSTGR